MGWVGTGWVGNHCSRPFEFSRMLTNRKERALRSFARMDGSFAARKHTTSFNPHKLKGTFLANVRLLYSRAHQLSQTIQLILIHASINSFAAREHTKSLVCLHGSDRSFVAREHTNFREYSQTPKTVPWERLCAWIVPCVSLHLANIWRDCSLMSNNAL